MSNIVRAAAAHVTVLAVAFSALTGCGWRGVNSLTLPGTAGGGDGSYEVQAQMPNVTNLQQNARVRIGDVNVGTVTKVQRQGWHALLTLRLGPGVVLPANATATIGQTSLLGSLHVELAPPAGVAPQGRLHAGSLIPLSAASGYPSTEQTLTAVAALLNGGGLGQIQDITKALSTAFAGREGDVRTLIDQLDKLVGHLNTQIDDILGATESLNTLVDQFASRKPILDKALTTIPDALAVLKEQRAHLVTAVDKLGKFSALTADAVNKTKEPLIAEFNNLAPVLEALGNAGPALSRSLGVLATYPYPKDTVDKWQRGDYANSTLILDLTLSRLDASLLTGTRWEGNLTELEMQWGRTIGQRPSPYTATNPLTVPYIADQGR